MKHPKKHLLDFQVDKLTNSIENVITKDSFKTDILPLTPKDVKNMFKTIEIDRNNFTIMGVKFSDLRTLESTANALGSNMFEGFKPTPKGVEIIRDYVSGKISLTELVVFAKQKAFV